MYLHANAKLGLAGRFALVGAIDQGMTLRRPRPPSACRRRRRIVGGTAGSRVAGKRAHWLIARVGRTARHGCSLRSCSSGSATVAARRVGVLGWSGA